MSSVKLQALQRVKFANISIYRHTPRIAAPQPELRERGAASSCGVIA